MRSVPGMNFKELRRHHEMADIIALNKCDSGREVAANQNALELKSALQLFQELRTIGKLQ